jgi:hypothetical protein
MPLTIRQRSQQVADYIQTHAASTIATIAEALWPMSFMPCGI